MLLALTVIGPTVTGVVPRPAKPSTSPAPVLREAVPAVPQTAGPATNGTHVSTAVMKLPKPGSVAPREVGVLEAVIRKPKLTPLGSRLVFNASSSNCTVTSPTVSICTPVSNNTVTVGALPLKVGIGTPVSPGAIIVGLDHARAQALAASSPGAICLRRLRLPTLMSCSLRFPCGCHRGPRSVRLVGSAILHSRRGADNRWPGLGAAWCPAAAQG